MSERELKISELKAENQQLRDALASLAAAVLREAAAESVARQPIETATVERLMREADDCFRSARMPELKPAIAEGLECAGRELMAKAVEIESTLQRERRKNNSPAAQPPREEGENRS